MIADAELLVVRGRELAAAAADARGLVIREHARLAGSRDPVTVQVDLTHETDALAPLIAAVDRWRALDAAGRPLVKFYQRVIPSLEDDIPRVDVMTAGVRWAFTIGDRRASVLESWERIAKVMSWASDVGVRERIEGALGDPVVTDDADARQRALIDVVGIRFDHAGFTGDADAIDAQPLELAGLGLRLRAYQEFGVRAALHHRRLLLGDEPGLGACVQALGLITAMEPAHHLVLASAYQQSAWARAVAEHTRLPVFRLADDRAAELWTEHGGVAISTHDEAPDAPPLGVLVVDDAHYLRERTGRRATAVASLADRGAHVLLLTSDPTFRVAGPDLRRRTADVPYELPEQTSTIAWVDPSPSDLAAFETTVASGNFSAMRRAGFASGDPGESAKLARVVEIVNSARKNGLTCAITSHFLRVLAASEHALSLLGFPTLGPLTESTPAEGRARALAEFESASEPPVLVTQLFDDGLRLEPAAADRIDITIVTEPPLEPVWVPGTVVYTLALAGTVDDGIVALSEERLTPTGLGRRVIAAHRRA